MFKKIKETFYKCINLNRVQKSKMAKGSKPDEDKKKQKESKLKFLKKRAPIYGVIIAITVIFLVPELTQSDLQSILTDDATGNEKLAIDMIKSYDGPNQKGLQIIDALSDQINDEYSDKKIFDHKDTVTNIFAIDTAGTLGQGIYEVHFTFDTYKENHEYVWSINIDTGEIKAINPEAKRILDIVNYS